MWQGLTLGPPLLPYLILRLK